MSREFIFREDRECDNCGSHVETVLSEWGPPFTQEHSNPQQALCAYCYSTSSMEKQENRNRAQMMNVLEKRLLAALGVPSGEKTQGEKHE